MGTDHGTMRLSHLERLFDDSAVLIDAVHLPAERLSIDLDLFAGPSHKA